LPPDFAAHFGSSKNPDFTKVQELMLEYENEHLKTLSTAQWFLYPFEKTWKVMKGKIGCCRKKSSEKSSSYNDVRN
jgi:hypothetical protein